MIRVEHDDWVVLVDVEANEAAYAEADVGDSAACQFLQPFRNYQAALEAGLVFPRWFLDLADLMGVDARKEVICSPMSGFHVFRGRWFLYQVIYPSVGDILDGGSQVESETITLPSASVMKGGPDLEGSPWDDYPPHFFLHFDVELRWVLEEPYEEENLLESVWRRLTRRQWGGGPTSA